MITQALWPLTLPQWPWHWKSCPRDFSATAWARHFIFGIQTLKVTKKKRSYAMQSYECNGKTKLMLYFFIMITHFWSKLHIFQAVFLRLHIFRQFYTCSRSAIFHITHFRYILHIFGLKITHYRFVWLACLNMRTRAAKDKAKITFAEILYWFLHWRIMFVFYLN